MLHLASIAGETVVGYGEPWVRADRELRRLAKERAAADYEEGRWIAVLDRENGHWRLGYASLPEYLERLFGYSPRLSREKVRVALALEELPELAQSLRDGVLNWSAVRELSRIATRETEGEWLDAVRGRSIREVERLVTGRKIGDRPTDRRHPELTKHALHFEVSPETFALFREAQMMVKRSAGEPLSEDETLRLIARAVLGGPKEVERAPYQIVIQKCGDCGRATQRGNGEEIPIDTTAVETAECDAQTIDLHAPNARATQEIPPAIRRLVVLRDGGRCIVPGCRNTIFLELHHFDLLSEGGRHDPERIGTLCGIHHDHVHHGRLIIEGRVSTGLEFRHADGTLYGGDAASVVADAMSDAFEALVALGFKQGESRRVLDRIRAEDGPRGPGDAPAIVKRSLQLLRAGLIH
jgi:hypothetical protein